ncbi:SUR7 protein [Colletotrichum tofieldiae]|uniref:SUR7 protein n=1 Tax=Colletotrichum tofieldiae TaxID=708197 RepID=A0A161YPQ9_9PEZI|nr:SUR7 protein [Colletotrichum tofieldiae]GKT63849.1 SUR7 protein [Colletotrichum tofieldiae]GKT72150.1 SUR7 protein [Colletotrichum tofieldiae]
MLGIGGRLSAIIPIIASAVAVALSIVLLAAGTNTSNAGDNYWLSLNTSKVGQNIIKIEAANNTNGNGNGGGGLIPGIPGDPTGITQGIGNALGGLLGNLTNAIGDGVQDVQGQLIGNLTQLLGVKDNYRLYLTKMCEATYADDSNPHSKVTINNCESYDDKGAGLRNITNSIPSSFVVGTANVSVPLVSAMAGTFDQVVNLASGGAKAMTALLAIGTISTGIVLLATLPILIFGFLRVLVLVSLIFSLIGSFVLPAFAAVTTGLIYGGKSMLNKSMDAFGMQIQTGGPFVAMAWVAAVASMAAATYWFMVWFVSFRRTAFSRRKRTESEIGNWRGIFREVKGDLRTWEGGEK